MPFQSCDVVRRTDHLIPSLEISKEFVLDTNKFINRERVKGESENDQLIDLKSENRNEIEFNLGE